VFLTTAFSRLSLCLSQKALAKNFSKNLGKRKTGKKHQFSTSYWTLLISNDFGRFFSYLEKWIQKWAKILATLKRQIDLII